MEAVMRSKMLFSSVSVLALIAFLAAATFIGTSTSGNAEGAYDQRISDLETRVAVLEAEVGISTPSSASSGTSGEDGESGSVNISSSSQSSSSSVQSNSNSYNASYASSGDMVVPFDIDNGGTYDLTARTSSPVSIRIETADGEEVPAFTLDSSGEETLTASDELEPGDYVLRVEASSQWTVTISSVSGE